MVLLLETDGFTLLHDPLPNWLYAMWMGRRSAEVMRQNYDFILQQVRRLRCSKLLNDSTEDKDGWSGLTAWLAQNCFPELAECGIQAVAWVLPKNAQAFRDIHQILASAKAPLIDVFHEAEAAQNWLQKWPK